MVMFDVTWKCYVSVFNISLTLSDNKCFASTSWFIDIQFVIVTNKQQYKPCICIKLRLVCVCVYYSSYGSPLFKLSIGAEHLYEQTLTVQNAASQTDRYCRYIYRHVEDVCLHWLPFKHYNQHTGQTALSVYQYQSSVFCC